MGINLPTYGLNATTVASRTAETPDADWADGMNKGGSNAPGVGINSGNPGPKVSDWTLLDQEENARDPQMTQHIGGSGLAVADAAMHTVKGVQGGDVNDTLSFVAAAQDTAPGDGLGPAGADPINRTGEQVLTGVNCWGTNTVA